MVGRDSYEEILDKLKNEKNKKLIEITESFKKSNNRNDLVNISNDAFELEKKYVPKWNKSQKADILIATVGMRKEPIILSTLILKVRKVHLLHTVGSEKTADDVIADKDLKQRKIQFEKHLIDDVDAIKIYKVVNKIMQNIDDEKVVIDPTSGRKAMSAGIASVAFYYDIPMKYLHGYEKMGIIMPFTEEMREIPNPYAFFGNHEINSVLHLMNAHNFSVAIERCKEIKRRIKNPMRRRFVDTLLKISEIYRSWDNFEHSKKEKNEFLSEQLNDILIDYGEEISVLSSNSINQMNENVKFLERIEEFWEKGNPNMADEYRIIDLFQNAQRLAGRGFYTDALARLYRLVELIAFKCVHQILRDNNIELVSPGEISKKDIENLNKKGLSFMVPSNANKLGLFELMKILEKKKTYKDLASRYLGTTQEDFREARNKSLAGHGTNPVKEELYLQYQRYIQEWLNTILKKSEFDELLQKSNFPDFQLNEN